MLQATELTKTYPGGGTVFKGLNFSLADDETLAVIGPSGCGKTTLLYLMGGLIRPDRGHVELMGREITGPTTDMALLLQDYGLLPWKTVLENVALGLKIQNVPPVKRRRRAAALLDELGLAGRENDWPSRLSGGQQQRVAIARALALKPKVMLLDEPFSSLDAQTRERLQQTLLATWQARPTPYILVTHSLEEAAFLGRRIIVLGGQPAEVTAEMDNPLFPDPDMRERPEYFHLVTRLRRLLNKAGDAS